jgi:hypothetical protein
LNALLTLLKAGVERQCEHRSNDHQDQNGDAY